MIIKIAKHTENYSVIDNFGANDSNISWKAKGLLWYLLSKPSDWHVSIADLVNRTSVGESSVRTGINELISAGYVKRYHRKIIGASDTYSGYISTDYMVYETPQTEGDMEGKPLSDNPQVDNQALLSTDKAPSTEKDKAKDRSASLRSQPVAEDAIKIWFPNLLPQNKRDILMRFNMSLEQKERLGMLMDLFFDGKKNAAEFLEAAGGMGPMFGLMTVLTHTHSVGFLVDWFVGMKVLPLCPNKLKWRAYFMTVFNKEYSQWSMAKSQKEARRFRREESDLNLGDMLSMMRQEGGLILHDEPDTPRPRRDDSGDKPISPTPMGECLNGGYIIGDNG